MGQKSKIQKLPDEVIAEINGMIGSDRFTLDQIIAHLRTLGHDDISRSSLHRHSASVKEIAEAMRRSRHVAEALTKELGPSIEEGNVSRRVIEMLQGVMLDMVTDIMLDAEVGIDPKQIMQLGNALKNMAAAQKLDVDRTEKIKEQAAREASKRAVSAAKVQGLGVDAIRAIERAVAGVEITPEKL
jgi:RecA/RadA recombinase